MTYLSVLPQYHSRSSGARGKGGGRGATDTKQHSKVGRKCGHTSQVHLRGPKLEQRPLMGNRSTTLACVFRTSRWRISVTHDGGQVIPHRSVQVRITAIIPPATWHQLKLECQTHTSSPLADFFINVRCVQIVHLSASNIKFPGLRNCSHVGM